MTAQPYPPGQLLRHVLAEQRMTRADLAEATGLSIQDVQGLISGTVEVTSDIALLIEGATGLSAVSLLGMYMATNIEHHVNREEDQ